MGAQASVLRLAHAFRSRGGAAASEEAEVTGGVITTDGDDQIHTFTTANEAEDLVVSGASVTFEVLMIGGGAGGYENVNKIHGGGGAGEFKELSGQVVAVGTYVLDVANAVVVKGMGYSTTWNGLTAGGGGRGGPWSSIAYNDGIDGAGSGGGGGGHTGSGVDAGSGGTGLAGNDGGDGYGFSAANSDAAGGGGGAGTAGQDGAYYAGGDGGNGSASSISGTSVTYCGGGAGNDTAGGHDANGGTGGGGNAAHGYSNTADSGVNGKGAGGGGAKYGGGGGSGQIIFRWTP